MSLVEPDRVSRHVLGLCRDRLHRGAAWEVLRSAYIKWIKFRYGFKEIGFGFAWGRNWDIHRNMVTVGHYVYIGPRVQIVYPTVIGDLTMIAADVQFVSSDHGYSEPGGVMRIDPPAASPYDRVTRIGADVWVGQRSIIFHGVSIGRGSIVAAGSVVTKDVEENRVVAGCPAREIAKRFDEREFQHHVASLCGRGDVVKGERWR